ncbi:hypothetical protein [Jeotgalibaca porci]|uniref:hypothetical protein n=1 Tax=Jeotgalibaca porci TaxID=1868793 RepID=UPI00359FD14F
MSKVLFGLMDKKIVLVDTETTPKAKKQALKEGCTTILVAFLTDELREKWINEVEVSMADFEGVEL